MGGGAFAIHIFFIGGSLCLKIVMKSWTNRRRMAKAVSNISKKGFMSNREIEAAVPEPHTQTMPVFETEGHASTAAVPVQELPVLAGAKSAIHKDEVKASALASSHPSTPPDRE